MRTLLPWLPAFLFGGILILVGIYLQSVEKKKRLQRKLSAAPLGVSPKISPFNMSDPPSPLNEMGAYRGKAQKKQGESIYKN
jgi:hypothetical protein